MNVSKPQSRFHPETQKVLRAAGWKEGRNKPRILRQYRHRFPNCRLFEAAEWAILEFGGLDLRMRRSDGRGDYSTIHFDPIKADYGEDQHPNYERWVGCPVYPLGDMEGHAFVVINPQGQVFGIVPPGLVILVGQTVDEAIENVILGRELKEFKVVARKQRISARQSYGG